MKSVWSKLTFTMLTLGIGLAGGNTIVNSSAHAETLQGRCVWVKDGAHLGVQVGNHLERVRLIGVDLSHAGPCADPGTLFVKTVALGKIVRIVTDSQVRDHSGGLLAYVYLPDGANLNERMIANGYARMGTLGSNTSMSGALLTAQLAARTQRLCVWAGDRGAGIKPAPIPRRPGVRLPILPRGGGGGPGALPSPPWRIPLPLPKPHKPHT